MSTPDLPTLSRFVWETRYRDPDARPAEADITDTWRRVAAAVASVEGDAAARQREFLDLLSGYRFLPAGRILAGAGSARHVTLFSCFVMGAIEDSIEGIFDALKEGALTMQRGGGIGYDFSTLRPRGGRARATGMTASGPVSFLGMWDAMCTTMLSTGVRRGAMMATLRCDHPDVVEFIDAKREPGALRNFNLSVLVSDAFMRALDDDAPWRLAFPAPPAAAIVERTISARELWERLCASAHASAEPGVLFIDRINAWNNLGYCETLSATNPCGEEPLPPYGACNLGSINLAAFVREPFAAGAALDDAAIAETAASAVRFLDDVIDISHFPLPQQRAQAHRARRIGLGMTGLGDALAMLGLRYDSEAARQAAARAMQTIRDAAYRTSVELAAERGSFPAFLADAYLERPFIRALPDDIRTGIRNHGIRNSHLTALAPAGSISVLAGNVSSGIEPIFQLEGKRRIIGAGGEPQSLVAQDHAWSAWQARRAGVPLPDSFVTARDVSARDQLAMQAALQPFVDGAISKTVALPDDFPETGVPELFRTAYRLGLKGCTIHRAQARAGVITK
ncbi:MAG: adenosylcobalamin-dependent ribonucleoside-diphosphate reductase [Steroidobacteraceae bacterium]